MKRFIKIISDVFFAIILGFIWGICVVIVLFTIIFAFTQFPIITICLTLCFFPFHHSAFKRFYRQGDWFVIGGRVFCLLLISSFLVGLFMVGIEEVKLNPTVLAYIFLFSFPILFTAFTSYFIGESFFPHSTLMRKIDNLVSGSKKLGIFWGD